MANTLTSAQIDRWRLLLDEMNSDEAWLAKHAKRDAQRVEVQQELLALLNQFLSKEKSIAEVKDIFDRNTRKVWDVFGLKGTSGAMFFNKMVKHVPDTEKLTEQLCLALKVPNSGLEGQNQMEAFYAFLQSFIDAGVSKANISPGFTPFFMSAWWHFQDTETWPIFYVSGRKSLQQEEHYKEVKNPVKNYFAFRTRFLELAAALKLTSWQLEHLFSWYTTERLVSPAPPLPKQTTSVPEPNEDVETEEESFTHTQVQWKLAQIGKKLGCRVWIAANDHNKQWNGHRLGDLSEATLPSLGMDPVSRKIISLIDVLWIKGFNQVVAAFEVEHTTSIYSGLLRMSDLTTVSPNLNVPLYIVTSQQRIDKVQRELSRPTFQMLELHKQCSFFSYELLMQEAENIMKWASDSTAIDNLAQKVDDVNYEDGI